MSNGMTITGEFKRFDSRATAFWVFFSLVIVAIVGVVDYLTGFELDFFAFYLIPVCLAVWYVGRGFGIFVSALCVVVSTAGDVIAGARYSSSLVPVWNTAIALTFFLVVVWILAKLRSLNNELEERVRQRTAALNKEIQDRMPAGRGNPEHQRARTTTNRSRSARQLVSAPDRRGIGGGSFERAIGGQITSRSEGAGPYRGNGRRRH